MQEINTGIVINNFMFYELGQSDFWEAPWFVKQSKISQTLKPQSR